MQRSHALIVGYGDIGQRVAQLGVDAGWRIRALVRSTRSMPGVEPVVGDLDQAASLRDLGRALDSTTSSVLLHFAPPTPSGECDPRTANLLAALESAPPRRIVYISTSGVYGDCGGAWVDETQPIHPANPRSRRRVDAEQQLHDFARRHAIALVVLRVPGIYGAGRYPLERLKRGDPVVCLQDAPWSNRIHQDDLAAIAMRAAQDDVPSAIYNVSDDAPSSMTDYFYRVADAAGIARPPCVSLFDARQTFSAGLLEYLNESRRLDNRRMKRELGVKLRYPCLADGLKSAV